VTNKYQPRNDFVVFQQRNKGTLRGVAIPDRAAEGKELVVVAVGPMVEDLAYEYLNSEENTLLDVIRVHGSDSRIDLATAARKLETLFRSGKLSL
jgi:hypothetical protein